MDNLLKQRLVGALILLALAIVFWPIIFVPTTQERNDVSVLVPPAPPVNPEPLPEPDNLGLRRGGDAQAQLEDTFEDVLLPDDSDANAPPASLPARDTVVVPAELEVARETLRAPQLDADGLPIAFSLQVATMGQKDRAEALRDELVNAGYKGYIKSLRRNNKTLYRVMVGPKYSRDELLPVKTAIDGAWRVDSLIIRYLP